MTRQKILSHKFVDHFPNELEHGTIYVSIPFATVAHRCCCGCGHEVITPLSPTDWNLTFDGRTISLYPSIGNWSLACRSHYWITCDKVEWATQWSRKKIEKARTEDRVAKQQYFDETMATIAGMTKTEGTEQNESRLRLWQKLQRWRF